MSELSPLAALVAVGLVSFAIFLFFLPLLMYNRVKGIERALWAVVSQLQAMRREDHHDIDPAATRRAREAAAPTGMISTSIFGR